MKKRLIYAVLAAAIFVIEIMIAIFTSGFIRGSVGDVLVVVLLFCVVRTIIPDHAPSLLPIYIFVFSCIVELLQLFHFVELMGWQDNRILSIVIGGTFSIYDLACYAVGAAICYGLQRIVIGFKDK